MGLARLRGLLGACLLLVGCAERPEAPRELSPAQGASPPDTLLIPARNPALEAMDSTDPERGFVPSPRFYGEATWDDVRMRVIGHLAVVGRDLARARAMAGDFEGCARAYTEAARLLRESRPVSGVGDPIRKSLASALERDAALCAALGAGSELPAEGAGFAAFRARALGALRRAARGEDIRGEFEALSQEAAPFLRSDPRLEIGAFGSFTERHQLRVRLVEAYADEVDPLQVTDPWGYREPAERPRQAKALLAALDQAARDTPGDALVLPARHLGRAGFPFFDVDEMGTLPTGDAWIDVGGFAGPRAIGQLERLSLEDQAWVATLTHLAEDLNAQEPARVPASLEAAIQTLRLEHDHGSLYYNLKQLRNTGVRVLARKGEYARALEPLRAQRPLRRHDWACPDREAILTGLEGRLQLLAGDPAAEATLGRALAESQAFLGRIARAEAGGPVPTEALPRPATHP
jgi:hypothetical protein